MNLANFIQEYLDQQGQELSDEQKLALELLEQQYPNESWRLKAAAEWNWQERCLTEFKFGATIYTYTHKRRDMLDFQSSPVKFTKLKLDLQTRWRNDDRFTHEKIDQVPSLKFYFSDSFSAREKTSISGYSSKDEIVGVAKQSRVNNGDGWYSMGDDFWSTIETRVSYDIGPKKRYRRERTYALNVWYEHELEAEIRSAIAKVEAKYQKKFVKHIDNKIQMADPFYAFVKNDTK